MLRFILKCLMLDNWWWVSLVSQPTCSTSPNKYFFIRLIYITILEAYKEKSGIVLILSYPSYSRTGCSVGSRSLPTYLNKQSTIL